MIKNGLTLLDLKQFLVNNGDIVQWWRTWSSGGVVVLGGGTRYLSVETSLFIHAKEQSPENRERQEWQKNCGD